MPFPDDHILSTTHSRKRKKPREHISSVLTRCDNCGGGVVTSCYLQDGQEVVKVFHNDPAKPELPSCK